MKLLLTGATGFVGRNFLLRAIHTGKYDEILLPVRSPEKLRAQLMGDGFEQVPSTVKAIPWTATVGFANAVSGYDHVMHSAGLLFGRNEQEYFEANVEGTLRFLDQVSGAQKIVLLSSQAASGPSLYGNALTEQDPPKPLTGYGRSKLEMERRIRQEFPNLPVVILRPPMVLGARDYATLPLFKLAKSPIRVKPGRRLKLYSFIAVEDLIDAIFAVLNSSIELNRITGTPFFVSHEVPISDAELIQTAGKTLNSSGITVPIPLQMVRLVSSIVDKVPMLRQIVPSLSADRAKEIMPDRWVINSQRFQSTFEWKARVELFKALSDACEWYVKLGLL